MFFATKLKVKVIILIKTWLSSLKFCKILYLFDHIENRHCRIAFYQNHGNKLATITKCRVTIELENSNFQHVNYRISIKSDFNWFQANCNVCPAHLHSDNARKLYRQVAFCERAGEWQIIKEWARLAYGTIRNNFSDSGYKIFNYDYFSRAISLNVYCRTLLRSRMYSSLKEFNVLNWI